MPPEAFPDLAAMFVESTGYLHPAYPAAAATGADVLSLSCGGHLLRNRIAGYDLNDAEGCYPLFCCSDWSRIGSDLQQLEGELVAATLVSDPFATVGFDELRQVFGDLCRPYKRHYYTDLTDRPLDRVSPRHRRNVRKALRLLAVEECCSPSDSIDEWVRLYSVLSRRHAITGRAAFSRGEFLRQFSIPGFTMLRCVHQGRTVAVTLWYQHNGCAYYHLGASDDEGYRLGAFFALFWRAIELFVDRGLGYLDFGGNAGRVDDPQDGLSTFKRRWTTTERYAYLCGTILNRPAYHRILNTEGIHEAGYFPPYRDPRLRPAHLETA